MSETQNPNELMGAAQDIAPLAWVIDEIRGSLNLAIDGVKVFIANKQDGDALKNARNQVHQAHGAMQLLDLRGVALATEAIEQLLRRWESEPKECGPSAVRTVETAVAAIIAYLEGLLSGRPNQPIRLYPYYRDVLSLNRAQRVHPADLIYPDLTRRPAFHQIEVKPLSTDQLRVRRVRFEEGLLGFLRNADDPKGRRLMREAVSELEHLPQRGLARSFWWVSRGLLDALDAGQVPVDIDLKRVLARLNLQFRRLIEGGGAVAERLMTDVLFYVGRAGEAAARVAEVKRLYGLDALIAPDFERPTLTAVDADALRHLKDALSHAKTHWGQIVGGAPEVPRFAQELARCIDAAQRLQAPAVSAVLKNVGVATHNFATLSPAVREALGLEVASALLFAEQGVDDLPQSDPQLEERGHVVAHRLQATLKGEPMPDSAPWMSELARRAQDRLTMASVVGETQTTLKEIEQRLDRFFRNPNERKDLPSTDPMFDQICGVLSVLGFDDPMAALRNVQASVRRFADPATAAQPEEFARIAQNLGAIGFFVESLAQDGERPRGMFRYDPATGVFSADIGQSAAAAEIAPADEFLHPPRTIDLRAQQAAEIGARRERPEAIEASVAQHQQDAVLIAQRLQAAPLDNAALQAYERLLQVLVGEADLLDDAALKSKLATAQQLFNNFREDRIVDTAAQLAQLFAPEIAPAPEPTAPLPTSEAAADKELHDIFVEEANEVLDGVIEQLDALAQARDDQSTQTTVRRAFHTLKGSSRMVGLKQFGEAAWSVEQCFNLWLAQERPATDDLLQLGRVAAALMRGWISKIGADSRAQIDVAALVRAAQRVREGGAFEFDGPLPTPAAGGASLATADPKSVGSPAEPAPTELPDTEQGSPHEFHASTAALGLPADTTVETIELAPPAEPPSATVITLPLEEPLRASGDDTRTIGPLEISHGLYSVFLTEADECIRMLAQDVAEWRFEPTRSVLTSTVRRAHSLAGISGTVGLKPVHEIADPLDDLMHALVRDESHRYDVPVMTPLQFDTLSSVIEKMRGMLHQFAAGMYPLPAPVQAASVRTLLEQISERNAMDGPASILPVGDDDAAEQPLAPASTPPMQPPLAAFGNTIDDVSAMAPATGLAANESPAFDLVIPPAPLPAPSVAPALDFSIDQLPTPPAAEAGGEAAAPLAVDAPDARHDAVQADPPRAALELPEHDALHDLPALPTAAATLTAASLALDAEPVAHDADADADADADDADAPVNTGLQDEIDADLLEIFVAEAHDLMPAISGKLRELQANPGDREVARELMRQLHTVKGSARMAGAMRLGELVHDMETRIESAMQLVTVPNVILEDLQSQYDQALTLFDVLQNPGGRAVQPLASQAEPEAVLAAFAGEGMGSAPLAPVIDLGAVRDAANNLARDPGRDSTRDAAREPAPALTVRPGAPDRAAAPAQPAPVIRVRADVLDKLVDQAGEVSIARAKLENEIGSLKGALTDLTENISRLRTQLREVEIQADAQIAARADQLSRQSATFDPLEFDRYTRLQELTRLLAESVEDVAMVQSNMLKGLGLAETDLTSQSRLTRELQQQLMRVRLVPFANVSERLYRVARQTAKELGKRVNLEIRGGTSDIDRGVLEKLAGPFEHLVRNAIVHGLELPEQRTAAGKRETGEIAIDVRQEGNEIVVVFADDGAGLNLARIKSRAIEKGLIAANGAVSDRELMELIFAPGFSTATEVTELAGRGVGMDVVRNELSTFGGRVAVASDPGTGTRFTLYLPLTLAVTQVVLAKINQRRYAIPAGMVEQVRRLKPAVIVPALSDGVIEFAPVGPVVLRPLAQLLGQEAATHFTKQVPVVLLRSGEDRLAIAVDDLSSNQEVVVKNVGAQVARLAGILGATILGNGEIVLIINPVQLIARAPEPVQVSLPPALPPGTSAADARRLQERPAAGQPAAPTLVMVVDDSLTVRRVTQRLLERNGFQVLLAKDGVDALRQLQDQVPDIMLVDIEMPRMDGYDLTRNVRSSAATRTVPIIMITSRTADKHRSMAFEIGVNEYLGKPYQEDELLALIKQHTQARAVV
jgi:chemosensory pili system protein ChpA (sensor histidine kinase/response regulator)